jgi:3-phytase
MRRRIELNQTYEQIFHLTTDMEYLLQIQARRIASATRRRPTFTHIDEEPPMSSRSLCLSIVTASLAFAGLDAALAQTPAIPAPPPPAVMATVETVPVASGEDAADDPAVWIDPVNPAGSLIVATDKKSGLELYDLSGRELQKLPDGRMNNVDLRAGFKFSDGEGVLVVASNRTANALGVYRLDTAARKLVNVAAAVYPTGLTDAYGLCMYRSAKTGADYVFVNDKDGRMRQWRLSAAPDGKVAAEPVRDFAFSSQVEGCAADDDTGVLYVAEEDVGLWRLSAEADGGDAKTSVAAIAGNPALTADLEGVGIYKLDATRGYIVVSVQGSNTYGVFRREGANDYLGSFRIVDDPKTGIDGVSETDGLEMVSTSMGPAFPHGALVTQDGHNDADAANQNYKLVPWDAIAKALNLE